MSFELICKSIVKNFQGLKVLRGVSFKAKSGNITGIIGPNGAGKTTLFACLTKEITIDSGECHLDGFNIGLENKLAYDLGITQTFQHIRLIPSLSPMDNVLFGIDKKYSYFFKNFLTKKNKKAEFDKIKTDIKDLFKTFDLSAPFEKESIRERTLFDLKKIELARALISKPKLLLLDELVAGLNDREKKKIASCIKNIVSEQIILLVEHDLNFIRNVCDTVHVLNEGMVIASDSPDQVFRHQEVKKVYLGKTSAKRKKSKMNFSPLENR